jgi:hypothetical protein
MHEGIVLCTYKELSLKSDGRNGERCMYFGCDFNGRGLNDRCYIVIVLNVEGKIGYGM